MLLLNNSETYKAFGAFIRQARQQQKIYQYEVADKVGVTQSYYSCIELGSRNISLTLALNICSVLDVNFNDFIIFLSKKKPSVKKNTPNT